MMNRLVLCFASICFANALFAQSNFVPVSVDDIEEQEEKLAFSPGLEFSLQYNAYASQIKGSHFERRYSDERHPADTKFEHDPRLYIKSIVNRDVFLHLEIGIDQQDVQDQNLRNEPDPESQNNTLLARQVFLEYRTNPNNSVKIGKQEVELGARKGKIFSGILKGATHSCRLGTWCYTLGAVKMADSIADWTYYGSLRYPFFETDLGGGKSHSFTIEVFRIDYNEKNIPLGISGAATTRNNQRIEEVKEFLRSGEEVDDEDNIQKTSRQVTDRNGNPIEYNAHRQKYFGFQILWQYGLFLLDLDATALQGKRAYHSDNTESRVTPDFGEEHEERLAADNNPEEGVSGFAIETEWTWDVASLASVFKFHALYATGDEQLTDEENEGKNIFRTSQAYHEITPGTYQGTKLYFNGRSNDIRSGTGLGHSVSNLSMLGFAYRYASPDDWLYYDIGLFHLARNKPVLNIEKEEVKQIGTELDNSLSFSLARNLRGEVDVNLFYTGDAFTTEQNEIPKDLSPQVIVQGVGRIVYQF